ncbi:MAG: thioredoxin domain-containing protein [Fimbriimonadaceae bacterium]|nr:thioredoxin domain-containing protein [Fimbriimonadaceae bacterium]
MNRLGKSRSPYLRQHAENPVAWQEWGDEAWSEAKRLDRPVFLSIGYSSCHWCHVMAHESFEDREVADALNRAFVCIKLDREERPDVDELYMTAVQVSSGHGGWPMSVFLTPDAEPFFAGTYFPKNGSAGRPGFLQIVHALASAWETQGAEVCEQAGKFAAAVRGALDRAFPSFEGSDPGALAAAAVRHAESRFDSAYGGFEGAPKFPPHSLLHFLQDYAAWPRAEPGLARSAGRMASETLSAIVRGGIHDHVGGGFHRYATDERWHLPHFEKMLSDNGLLLEALSRDGGHPGAVSRLVAWLGREMTAPEGWFYSALDADIEGEEGITYTWTLAELQAVLGAQAKDVAHAFQVSEAGNYLDEASRVRTGRNVLHLLPGAQVEKEVLDELLATRNARPHPGLDDKGVAAWNAFAIRGLVAAGATAAAVRCGENWMADEPMRVLGGDVPGFLEDYAALADAMLDLADVTGGERWRESAERIAHHMVERFGPASGLLRFSSEGHGPLLGVSRPILDGSTPAPNALAVRALRRVGRHDDARAIAEAGLGWVERAPGACSGLLRELIALEMAPALRPTRKPLGTIEARLEPVECPLDSSGSASSELVLNVPPGYFLTSHDPIARWMEPLEVRVEGVHAEAGFPEAPEGSYAGEVRIPLRLQATKGREFAVTVRAQLCSESECLLPQELELTGKLV